MVVAQDGGVEAVAVLLPAWP